MFSGLRGEISRTWRKLTGNLWDVFMEEEVETEVDREKFIEEDWKELKKNEIL